MENIKKWDGKIRPTEGKQSIRFYTDTQINQRDRNARYPGQGISGRRGKE